MIADPEIQVAKLSGSERFIIVASDGVWEFISSQQAVDLVGEGRGRGGSRGPGGGRCLHSAPIAGVVCTTTISPRGGFELSA